MSSDPLARSDIWAGAPNETEYDAVYAAVMATERGRWFLTEYANRNRHADTQALIGAIARVEAAIRGDAVGPSSASLGRDLIEIAAAIERLKAIIGAERIPGVGVAGFVERIQDIAFTLRERASEPALCNALDAAVRELGDACTQRGASGDRAQNVAGLLRELAGRVDSVALAIAARGAENGVAPPAIAAGTVVPQPATAQNSEAAAAEIDAMETNLFTMSAQDTEKFAATIAALTVSLNPLGDPSAPASEPQSRTPNKALPPATYDDASDLTPSDLAPSDVAPNGAADGRPRSYIEPPEFALHQSEGEATSHQAEAGAAMQRVASSAGNGQAHSLLPEAQLLPGPQDDPAELFELPAAVADMGAASAPGPAVPATPTTRSAPPDPLAGISALSQEEVIALFS